MSKLCPLVVSIFVVVGCSPPGESSKDLTGGYEWIKHDGESQLVRADGNIILDRVEQASTEGALIKATIENGAEFEVDSRTGQVQAISGERQ